MLAFLGVTALVTLVYAQTAGGGEEVSLGKYSIPVIMMVILGLFYKIPGIKNKHKPLLAIAIGIVLGIIAIPYTGKAFTFVNVVDFVLYGLMTGASAVGLYESAKSLYRPRP